MADNKKWSWIKLTPAFFDDYKIKLLQATDNGDSYLVFYIKLLAESASHNGALRYSDEIPYDEKSLSVITNTNIDTVSAAIIKLQQLGLLSVFDNKTYFINRLYEHVGTDNSPEAKRKRKERYLSGAKGKKTAQLSNNLSKEDLTVREKSEKSHIEYKSNRVIEFKSNKDINTLSVSTDLDSPKKAKYNYLNDVSFIAKSEEIIKHLNKTLNKPKGKEFSNKTKTTLSLIHSRLKEGRTVEDFKYVITNQHACWQGTEYQKYLRPQTLFGNKFEGYLMAEPHKEKPRDFNQKPKYEKPKY